MARVEPTFGGISDEVENPYQLSGVQLTDDVLVFSKPKVFDFSGRISLSHYWLFHLPFAVVIPTCLLAFFIAGLRHQPAVLIVAVATVLVFSLLLSVSLLMRRSRDLGWSPVWGVIATLPFIGFLVFLPLVTFPGKKAENKYGSPNTPMSKQSRIFTCLLLVFTCVGLAALFTYFPEVEFSALSNWIFSYLSR